MHTLIEGCTGLAVLELAWFCIKFREHRIYPRRRNLYQCFEFPGALSWEDNVGSCQSVRFLSLRIRYNTITSCSQATLLKNLNSIT